MRRSKKSSKALALILSVAMLLSVGTTAIAAEDETNFDNLDTEVTENTTIDGENSGHFDAMQPFSLSDLEGYSMKMDGAEIPKEYFNLKGEGENIEKPCDLSFDKDLKSIPGGLIRNSVPAMVQNADGIDHAFAYAKVGDTRVYYMGKLTIYEGDSAEEYIYYTTDTYITKKTVYAVLNGDEQITLVYKHGTYYKVNYQFQEQGSEVCTEEAPEGWTVDDTFGENRPLTIAEGEQFSTTITIPRGYKAYIFAYSGSNMYISENPLGKMIEYNDPSNNIISVKGNTTSMKRSEVIKFENIIDDVTVTVQYEKVNNITFDARKWTNTAYAGSERIAVKNADENYENANDANSILTTDGHEFTWDIYAKNGWEMDQLEINGEAITVPMAYSTDTSKTEYTTLSTGTEVSLTLQPLNIDGGIKRNYILEIKNCYENLTISGGNMTSTGHRELALRRLEGVEGSEFWSTDTSGTKYNEWNTLLQDTLIDKKTRQYKMDDPFRVKIQTGYEQKVHVSFTTKDGVPIQTDGESSRNSDYIEYLIRTDTDKSAEKNTKGDYAEPVSYEDWHVSDDGYFYFRASNNLDNDIMNATNSRDKIVLVNIYADPIRNAIAYVGGADSEATNAPKAEDIENMPAFQDGGKYGYNIKDNPTALVSYVCPTDKSENYIFDHWEILTVKDGKPTGIAKTYNTEVIKVYPGDDIHVSKEIVKGLSDCLYYDEDTERNVLTLRAVWESRKISVPIKYTVRYFLDFADGSDPIKIEEHTHTVNKGAMLVTDLYQDGNKTLSANIMAVLEGDNANNIDYTENADWKVDEDRTTKRINSVSQTDNVADIYLVKRVASLMVTKFVGGFGGELNKDFNFTVKLNDESINGTFGDMTFTNGEATFTLKHKESKKATGLPIDIEYEVTETEADQDGYTTTSTNASGTLTDGEVAAIFTNTKDGYGPSIEGPSTNVPNKPDNNNPGDQVKPDDPSNQPNQPDIDNPDNQDKPDNPNNPDKPNKPNHQDKPNVSDKPNVPNQPNQPNSTGSQGNPKTGDTADLPFWFALFGATLLALLATINLSRRKAK